MHSANIARSEQLEDALQMKDFDNAIQILQHKDVINGKDAIKFIDIHPKVSSHELAEIYKWAPIKFFYQHDSELQTLLHVWAKQSSTELLTALLEDRQEGEKNEILKILIHHVDSVGKIEPQKKVHQDRKTPLDNAIENGNVGFISKYFKINRVIVHISNYLHIM